MNRPRSKMWIGAAAFAALVAIAGGAHAIDEFRHPRLNRAAQELDGAAQVLGGDERPDSDYNGHRSRALELIRQARFELDQAASYADSPPPPPPDYNSYNGESSYTVEPSYDDPPSDWIPPPQPVVYYAPPPPTSPVGFWGHHPIPGGGWCLAEGPHVHYYEPEFFDQFHLVDGYFKFGEGFHDWMYAGPHPIAGGGWCNIMGPHRHEYRPEVGFIYDPVRRGYYYDRERAVVIRTEVVRAPPNYRPPVEVVAHFNAPPPLRRAPEGTPPPHVWEHERVVEAPHPAGRPPPVPQNQMHPMGAQPNNHPFGAQPAPGVAHPAPMAHPEPMREPPPMAHPAPMHEPAPAAHPSAPAPVAHPAPAAQPPHAPPPPAAHPAAAPAPVKPPPAGAKPAPKPPEKKKPDEK